MAGSVIHWSYKEAAERVLSAHEAELNGAVRGTSVGASIRSNAAELPDVSPNDVALKPGQEHQAAIASLMHEAAPRLARLVLVTKARLRHDVDVSCTVARWMQGLQERWQTRGIYITFNAGR